MDAVNALLNAGLGFASDLLWSGFSFFLGFFLDYFPDADPAINGYLDNFGSVISGEGLTFNVMYFIDVPVLGTVLGMVVTVILISKLYDLINRVIELVTNLMDAIPTVVPLPV